MAVSCRPVMTKVVTPSLPSALVTRSLRYVSVASGRPAPASCPGVDLIPEMPRPSDRPAKSMPALASDGDHLADAGVGGSDEDDAVLSFVMVGVFVSRELVEAVSGVDDADVGETLGMLPEFPPVAGSIPSGKRPRSVARGVSWSKSILRAVEGTALWSKNRTPAGSPRVEAARRRGHRDHQLPAHDLTWAEPSLHPARRSRQAPTRPRCVLRPGDSNAPSSIVAACSCGSLWMRSMQRRTRGLLPLSRLPRASSGGSAGRDVGATRAMSDICGCIGGLCPVEARPHCRSCARSVGPPSW